MTYTRPAILAAGRSLGRTMIYKAARMTRDLGFSYVPVDEPPETLEELLQALHEAPGKGFPVWAGASSDTIYGAAEANWAFRFLHDLSHCVLAAPTTSEHEHVVHAYLAKSLRIGSGHDMTLEDRLYWIDSAGQTMHFDMHGQFPVDQLEFCIEVLQEWQKDWHLMRAVERATSWMKTAGN
jgi:hypothetical protein